MTTKLEQAARQALECLEDVFGKGKVDVGAINALREALAEQADMNLNCKSVQARLATSWGYVKAEQVEQDPVAWRCVIPRRTWTLGIDWGREYFENEYEVKGLQGVEPLYAAPVRTKDLTDDEIADALYGKGCWRLGVHPDHLREYRRVIQADREKNK